MSIFFDRARIVKILGRPRSIVRTVQCWCLSSHISLALHGLMDEFLI